MGLVKLGNLYKDLDTLMTRNTTLHGKSTTWLAGKSPSYLENTKGYIRYQYRLILPFDASEIPNNNPPFGCSKKTVQKKWENKNLPTSLNSVS